MNILKQTGQLYKTPTKRSITLSSNIKYADSLDPNKPLFEHGCYTKNSIPKRPFLLLLLKNKP